MLTELNFWGWAVQEKLQVEAIVQKQAIYIQTYRLLKDVLIKATRGRFSLFSWSIQDDTMQKLNEEFKC